MTVHSAAFLVPTGCRVKTPARLTVEMPSSKTRPMRGERIGKVLYTSAFAVFGAVLALALGGASCDKKSVANPTEPGPAVPFEAPKATGAAGSAPDSTKVAAATPSTPS